MRTIVELYDKEPVENVLSACIFKPDMVVYVCDVRDNTLRKEQAVMRLFKSRGLKTKARFYYIDTTSPKLIERLMRAIVQDYPGCVVNFSGGKDLVLLTAGVFCYQNNVPSFYIDIATSRFINLRGCEQLANEFAMPHFKAQDILSLAGAQMLGNGHFPQEEITDEFAKDALFIWQNIFRSPKSWNDLAGFLQAAGAGRPENDLTIHARQELRVNAQVTARCSVPLLEALAQGGIVQQLRVENGTVSFQYKNERMKKCLQNHGIWLEMYAFLTARNSGHFDDVRTSVIVDWDNATSRAPGTRNEIDVLLTQGITPIFVSCKMGLPTPLALSEIKIISEKFGGEHTKTVLLTASDVRGKNSALAQRARDLGIWLFDRADLQKGGLAERLDTIAKAKT